MGSPICQVRVFMSFDLGHDHDLKRKLLAEAKQSGSGFEIQGCSEGAEMTASWSEGVRRRIAAADEVIVVCGEHTQDSLQVAAEIGIAQEEQKPYFLLWGRREVMCKKPVGARPDDGMYSWTTTILRDQVAATLRMARSLDASKRLRRHRADPAPRRSDLAMSSTPVSGSGTTA